MASLTIRNFDDSLKDALRLQAARQGHSMEQEAREILRRAVQPPVTNSNFAKRIQKHFAGLEIDELPIPKRRAARLPSLEKG
jgi:antitoxin FitA